MLDVDDVCISTLFTKFLDYNSIAASPESLQLCCCVTFIAILALHFPVVHLVCDELRTTFARLDRYKLRAVSVAMDLCSCIRMLLNFFLVLVCSS
jgi:hypothetical protein